MDPNETLRRIRDLLYVDAHPEDALEAITEAFENLDEWLTKGGFLPDDWSKSNGQ